MAGLDLSEAGAARRIRDLLKAQLAKPDDSVDEEHLHAPLPPPPNSATSETHDTRLTTHDK